MHALALTLLLTAQAEPPANESMMSSPESFMKSTPGMAAIAGVALLGAGVATGIGTIAVIAYDVGVVDDRTRPIQERRDAQSHGRMAVSIGPSTTAGLLIAGGMITAGAAWVLFFEE